MQLKAKKVFAFLLSFLLIFEQTGFAQVAGQLDISSYLSGLHNSLSVEKFRPLHLRYLQYIPQDNSFKLLLDKGNSMKGLFPSLRDGSLQSTFKAENRPYPLKGTVPSEGFQDETKLLLKYFFIGLSLPNDSFWVNLRPDSPENIIDPYVEQTDIGRIMLETDLQLKKDTSRYTSPEAPEGKEYWNKLYKKAEELYGTQQVTIPTLTRPWIVPGEIIIRETTDSAYIYKATLKVMLEEDYLRDGSQSEAKVSPENRPYAFTDPRAKALNEYSAQLIREIIIPKLTKEINNSQRYASLRQVYYSLILASWFKARFQKGLSPSMLSQGNLKGTVPALIDSHDLTNLTSKEPWSKNIYFQEYQKSFKEGEYNIQQPVSTPYGQNIRSYFSGGISGIAPPLPELGRTIGNISSIPTAGSSAVNEKFLARAESSIFPVRYSNLFKPVKSASASSAMEFDNYGIAKNKEAREEAIDRYQDAVNYFLKELEKSKEISVRVPRNGSGQEITVEARIIARGLVGSFMLDKARLGLFPKDIDYERAKEITLSNTPHPSDVDLLTAIYIRTAPGEKYELVYGAELSSYNIQSGVSGFFLPLIKDVYDKFGVVIHMSFMSSIERVPAVMPTMIPIHRVKEDGLKKVLSSSPTEGEDRKSIVSSTMEAGSQEKISLIGKDNKFLFEEEITDLMRKQLLLAQEREGFVEKIASIVSGRDLEEISIDSVHIALLSYGRLHKYSYLLTIKLGTGETLNAVVKSYKYARSKRFDLETNAFLFLDNEDIPEYYGSWVYMGNGQAANEAIGEDSYMLFAEAFVDGFSLEDYIKYIMNSDGSRRKIKEAVILSVKKYASVQKRSAGSFQLTNINPKNINMYTSILGKLKAKIVDLGGMITISDPARWLSEIRENLIKPAESLSGYRSLISEEELFAIVREILGEQFLSAAKSNLWAFHPEEADMDEYPQTQTEGAVSTSVTEPVASSAMINEIPHEEKLAGIDFRSLPIVIQAMSSLKANLRDSPLLRKSIALTGTVPSLEQEWQDIERLVGAGIAPSAERIKEYVASSCLTGKIADDLEKVVSCIADILRQEEERCCETETLLRDILVLLESATNTEELENFFRDGSQT
ncbi:MAG: hypothetical protein AB1481_05380 [Candidatus Omnitrophota bacterium]